MEHLDVKSTKVYSLSLKSAPPGALKSYISPRSLPRSSVTATMFLPVTPGFCFQEAHLKCDFLCSPLSAVHFSGEGRGGSLRCDLSFLGSLRKVIGF